MCVCVCECIYTHTHTYVYVYVYIKTLYLFCICKVSAILTYFSIKPHLSFRVLLCCYFQPWWTVVWRVLWKYIKESQEAAIFCLNIPLTKSIDHLWGSRGKKRGTEKGEGEKERQKSREVRFIL